jgi:hypothetical protein
MLSRIFSLNDWRYSGRMTCAACARSVIIPYAMGGDGQVVRKCLRCALRHRPLMRRAFFTALIVGSVLTTINQLDVLLHHGLEARVLLKVGLTYMVPYCVTTWGAIGNARAAGLAELTASSHSSR